MMYVVEARVFLLDESTKETRQVASEKVTITDIISPDYEKYPLWKTAFKLLGAQLGERIRYI